MGEQVVDIDVADGIATITINRPEHLNAVNGPVLVQLIAAIDTVSVDDDVRCVIVTGAGRAFCAGADLSGGGDTFRADPSAVDVDAFRDGAGLITLRLFDSPKPFIAAVNGAAVGIGASMTCAMDVRLVSTTARYGFVFARRGMVPEGASGWFLPRIVGSGKALEWMLTGRLIDAQEALSAGLANAIYAPDELLPAARRMAREIADNVHATGAFGSAGLLPLVARRAFPVLERGSLICVQIDW